MSQYTTRASCRRRVDFGFQGSGVDFAKGKATTELRDFFARDDYYTDADSNAYSLPTFLGNHDMGRVGSFLRDDAALTGDELLQRDELAHSLMYLTRGQPVVYYGDEQGFTGRAGGSATRTRAQDMFATQVAAVQRRRPDRQRRRPRPTRTSTPRHPLYQHIAGLAAAARASTRRSRTARRSTATPTTGPGIFAFSRIDAEQQRRVRRRRQQRRHDARRRPSRPTAARSTLKAVWPASARAQRCSADSDGRVTVTVPPLSVGRLPGQLALRADRDARRAVDRRARCRRHRRAAAPRSASTVPGDDFAQVTFAWRPVGTTTWTPLGTDDNAPYRVFHDVSGLRQGHARRVPGDRQRPRRRLRRRLDLGRRGRRPQPPAARRRQSAAVRSPQPGSVSVPGSHGSEIGCAARLGPALRRRSS